MDSGSTGLCTSCNVVLVSLDTLRADHLSLYGYERPTSPFLERLASEAVVFDQFVQNAGGTLPSHLTMMTSLPPTVHGIWNHTPGRLPSRWTTLAERLRAAGFATGAFVDSGFLRARFGFVQGFDLYDDAGGRFQAILPKAYRWLERNHNRRFFLFLHSYDAHSEWEDLPYKCPGEAVNRYTAGLATEFDGCRDGLCASRLLIDINRRISNGELTAKEAFDAVETELLVALYDGCINYVDRKLEELVGQLQRLGVWENTLFIVTSDHGEAFGEHGLFLHDRGGYEELARVPLVVRFPAGYRGGLRVRRLAAMVDLVPTILASLGEPPLESAQGVNLLPAVQEGGRVRGATHLNRVVRTDRWKFFADERLLFDLASDPSETTNVLLDHPDIAADLESWLNSRLATDHEVREGMGSTGPGEVLLGEDARAELEALGYLQ